MTFDLERAVKEGCRTRDGRSVRILCTDKKDGQNAQLVLGLVDDGDIESVLAWFQSGANFTGVHSNDLVNIPEAHDVTVQIYKQLGSRLPWPFEVAAWVDGRQIASPTNFSHGAEVEWKEWGKPVTVRIEED